ncbi:MAG: FAD-binding protein [Burkholderiales bacterium]
MKQARDADAIVVGAGAAGLMAALAAAHAGANVLLLERDLGGPSNLLVSGGLFPSAGSRYQRAAGIDDNPARFAADIRAKGGAAVNEAIVDTVAARSTDVAPFIADVLAIPIHVMVTITAPGHSVPRLHATPKESGRELHAMLRAAAGRQARLRLLDRAEVRGLVVEAGRVVGVEARVAGEERVARAPSTLLATGGFGGNRSLLGEFIPEMADALNIGAGPNDGCAIAWSRPLGADVALMDGYQGQGHVNPPGRTRLGMALPPLGAIMLNRDGERFVREDVGPSALAAFVLRQPGGRVLELYDRRIHDAVSSQGAYRDAYEAGKVMIASDVESLAQTTGVPRERLEAALAATARYARGEATDPLGRTQFAAPLAPPYYASWVTGALAHTQGGLRIDDRARVLRADGAPIAGLYAAGGAAAGLSGKGGDGYLPGNGFGQCFPLGLIAGEQMAAAARA